jgi:hypothetical protein
MVDHTEKKERRRKTSGAGKRMTHVTAGPPGPDASPDLERGLSPNLQAHIGRHLRAAFDEVAREPIPERLLQLLKDLEQNGDK